MKKTNDSYCVVFQGDRIAERYYRDKSAWLKVSNRGPVFRMTSEQVFNHVLPALAFGDKLGLKVTVEHYEHLYWQTTRQRARSWLRRLRCRLERPAFMPTRAPSGQGAAPELRGMGGLEFAGLRSAGGCGAGQDCLGHRRDRA
jgi:hypothetical protein